ncbi:MAG: hypothetical protein AAGE65_01095 [Planctomycetota bacterium]
MKHAFLVRALPRCASRGQTSGAAHPLCVAAALAICFVAGAHGTDTFSAHDTPFPPSPDPAPHAAFAQAFRSVAWTPEPFEVVAEPAHRPDASPLVRAVRFPSAHGSDDPRLATVTARWFVADGREQPPAPRPAVVLVHTLHPQTPLTELLATAIARRGVHAVLVHLPGYGLRSRLPGGPDNADWPGVVALRHAARGVADVRRACDAAAALPGIDPNRVVLQGSSLGSFPAAVAAGLDARRHALLLLLGGGHALDAIEHGRKDAARFRQTLERSGIDAEQRARLIAPLEPLNVAHRLDPATTWLLAARNDTVIPPRNAQAFADAVGLTSQRFVRLSGNHYTASFALPAVADLLVRIAESDAPAQLEAP